MRAVLKAQINKTDRNDARGIAQMMRAGLYRPVHVKTLGSQKLRALLTHRKLLQSKAIAIENELRASLRNFGLKVGMIGTMKFEARIRELVERFPDLAVLVEPLLIVRRVIREQLGILHRRLLAIVRDDDVCRRLMTIPGVGPVVALTYRVTVDAPARFRKSKAVGARCTTSLFAALAQAISSRVRIGSGRPRGANTPLWPGGTETKEPSSFAVGTSGRPGKRVSANTARTRKSRPRIDERKIETKSRSPLRRIGNIGLSPRKGTGVNFTCNASARFSAARCEMPPTPAWP